LFKKNSPGFIQLFSFAQVCCCSGQFWHFLFSPAGVWTAQALSKMISTYNRQAFDKVLEN